MPRANRYLLDGRTYHLTHRCQNQEFLLAVEQDRDTYRKWLREGVSRFKVPLLSYCLTSNHVHLIVQAESSEAVAEMMHLAAGATARDYNRRKDRSGSFWEDQYKCTAIQNGRHLRNCIVYVHMNMVRAGGVRHPREWKWCGHDELVGSRKRFRMLDLERLIECTGSSDLGEFRSWYEGAVGEKVRQSSISREPAWSDSLAVGSKQYIEEIQRFYTSRSQLEVFEIPESAGESAWAVREVQSPYSLEKGG
ncbi:MAG: transposase [Planctomycetes bacterium]|nr:transposase [Planctomycetota bacterium]